MFYGLNKLAMGVSNFVFLSNPVDFLKDPSKNNHAFDGVQNMAEGYFASAYQVMQVVGLCLFVLAGLAAAILFGILKNSTKVQENKAWILRVIGAVVIFALILEGVGIAFAAGSANIGTVTPTPTI